jgi:GntR family transcriptional regulator, transcriptional repressor for pyruvate dehydrogenase complex
VCADLGPRLDARRAAIIALAGAESAEGRNFAKQKAAVIVARRIVAAVERERLGPGDKLPPERTMQEQYGVGRSTLREALRFLELQGVLALKTGPGGGPVLRRPSSSHLATTLALTLQFKDAPFRVIVEARMGLEPMMAGLAAGRIDPAELGELSACNVVMAEPGTEFDVFLAANQRFHDVIARASGNALLASILQSLFGILDGTALGIRYPPQSRMAITAAHRQIYERLAAGDVDGATEAMREHTAEYLHYVEQRYPHLLDRRVTWDMLPL